MQFIKKDPIIFLVAGRARSGKGTIAKYLENYYQNLNKKVIISPYTKYLKKYIEDITGEKIDENNKPRELLQKISSDLIKKELNKHNFFIDRQLEDLEIYSYFADIIIIPDVRFEKEIEVIKERYSKVISIGVKRPNYQSELTKEQLDDITETSLDNYKEYDYLIINDESLKKLNINLLKILEEIKKEGMSNE